MNEFRPFEDKEINVLRPPTRNSNWSECNKCPMMKAIGSPSEGKKFRNNINKRHMTKVLFLLNIEKINFTYVNISLIPGLEIITNKEKKTM